MSKRTLIFRTYIELRYDSRITVKCLTAQSDSKHSVIRWAKFKGSAAILVFLAVAVFVQIIVVLYAIDLGVRDNGALTAEWPVKFTISPMFHLIPLTVVIALSFSWIYLTKKLSVKPISSVGRTETTGGRRRELRQQTSKTSQPAKTSSEKPNLSSSGAKGLSGIWERVYSARAIIKSALIVFLAFLGLVFVVSMLTYPAAIYDTITGSYGDHSSLYGFVLSVSDSLKGFAQTVAPIGWVAATVNNGLVAISPGVRSVGLALGSLSSPLANLDAAGKYLAFQNAAAWIPVLLILFYGQFSRRTYRYKKK